MMLHAAPANLDGIGKVVLAVGKLAVVTGKAMLVAGHAVGTAGVSRIVEATLARGIVHALVAILHAIVS